MFQALHNVSYGLFDDESISSHNYRSDSVPTCMWMVAGYMLSGKSYLIVSTCVTVYIGHILFLFKKS